VSEGKRALIQIYARQLRIPTFGRYEDVLRDATQHGWNYEEFLCELMAAEIAQRRENQQRRRVKAAGFPLIKALDTFDFKQLPNLDAERVWQIADGSYIAKHENLVLIGNPGTGKTHLSIALGVRACAKGFRVKFTTASLLASELLEAQQQGRLVRLMRQFSKTDLLILDELSYLTLSKQQAELVFQVLGDRTERASVIITTNLEFSRWAEVFGDNMMTAALVDRLTHKSYILDMNGESYRLKQRRKESEYNLSGVDHVQASTGGSLPRERCGSESR
jgi:DNA replication protein DnaC